MRHCFLLAAIVASVVACEQRRPDIGKDPVHSSPVDPSGSPPPPTASASAAPLPSFSGRDPFKPPGDASSDTP
ncbi:MAG: hypothetical protein ABI175_29055 [Polyangiales bacterium]